MAEVTAAMIKELRERTGLPMMECKGALVESQGDLDAAIDVLRKKSSLKAEKKAGRVAAEGLLGVALAAAGSRAAMVEVNTETDFAARNEKFSEFVARVAQFVVESGESDVAKLEAGELGRERERLIQVVGENMTLRRATFMAAGAGERIGNYLHSDNKKGTLVLLKGGNETLARDIAMHVTGVSPPPIVVRGDEVSADLIAKEREIYTAQAAESGKPAEIVAKMVEGRVRKFLADVSLLEQAFVRDPDTKVGKLLANNRADCLRFVRMEVGEGIEKGAGA